MEEIQGIEKVSSSPASEKKVTDSSTSVQGMEKVQGKEEVSSSPTPEKNVTDSSTSVQGMEKVQGKEEVSSSPAPAEENDVYYWRYIPLHNAALRGDWESARSFLNDVDQGAASAFVTIMNETALHVAVSAGKKAINFVERLVELMPETALELCDSLNNNALHTAALVGNTQAVQILLQKHPTLLSSPGFRGCLPIHLAAFNAHKETVFYLMTVTPEHSLPSQAAALLLSYVIMSGLYDIALELVQKYPQSAKSKGSDGVFALAAITSNPSLFPSGSRLNCWQRLINFLVPLPHIRQQKRIHLQVIQLVKRLCKEIRSLNDYNAYLSFFLGPILTAARLGIPEVVEEIVESFPAAIWSMDSKKYNIFFLAIAYRCENVFNLIYQMSEYRQVIAIFTDDSGNTMLHVAGRLSPLYRRNLVPSAALQMQRELQWFKEVEKLTSPNLVRTPNNDGNTPAMLFTEEHKKLVQDGEKWMKDTANSCTIAAALIATIAFAAAITVPGGSNSTSGLPIFSKERAFIVFAISDAISLFASTTSLLMFLSILTSRYAEGDFLHALPKRLIIGLVTLFLSITTMILAFSSTLYLVSGHQGAWILFPIAVLACLPVTTFVFLQFPLLVDLISSTYGPGIFGKQSDRPFY